MLEFYVGITGALILLVAVTTSISGFARLAYSLGEHGQLPRSFGRLSRRAHVSPQAIIAAAVISSAIVIATSFLHHDVAYLASLFSFGVLIAFTAAQLAVIKLRISEPDLVRPYRVPLNVRIRGYEIPVPSIVGAIGTGTIFVIALVTHPAARYAGPVWLAIGLVVFVAVRHAHGEGLMEQVIAPDERTAGATLQFKSILVPMKLGIIGEEMLATAIKLASDPDAQVHALHVIRVPLELPLDAPLEDEDERAEESLAEARLLGSEHSRGGRRDDGSGASDRRRDRGVRARARRRPDRARVSASLAAPVPLLLADRRLRAAQSAVRGVDRRLPADRHGRGARGHVTPALR